MHYHILLTEICNLKCRYCYEKSMNEFDNGLEKKFEFDYSDPTETQISLQKLQKFLEKDPEPTLIFYGGEPLLKIDKIKEIIDTLPKINYRMQTNGILLNKLPINYLKKIDKILISLDGNCKRTNLNRGQGIYEKVLENIKKARSEGYTGEIVARMTITNDTPDLYEQVIHLIGLIDQKIIDSIHWQIDAGFYKTDFEIKKTSLFFEKYNKSNLKLINWWIEKIKQGKVYKIYPYIGIIKPLLENNTKPLGLRCGAGHSGYAISTSGKIVHCPIMNNIENFKAGTLDSNPKDLKKLSCSEICDKCEVYNLCGGRCMYWRKAQLWPKEGNQLICESIKIYINELKKDLHEIQNQINNNKLSKKDFNYEDYFGPEIIP